MVSFCDGITLLEEDFKNTKTYQYKRGQHVVRTLIFFNLKKLTKLTVNLPHKIYDQFLGTSKGYFKNIFENNNFKIFGGSWWSDNYHQIFYTYKNLTKLTTYVSHKI